MCTKAKKICYWSIYDVLYYSIKGGFSMTQENNFIYPMMNILENSTVDFIEELTNSMSNYQRKVFNRLTTDNSFSDNYSLSDLLFDFDVEFIEKILEIEIDVYLKTSIENNEKNKRNGYTKNISLTVGDRAINYNRPRLRNEKDFKSILIPKKTRILKDLSDNIILLYSKNNSVNDIKQILASMFNISVSTATISAFVNEIAEEVLAWRNKQLQRMYFTVNFDCTYISIRDNKNLAKHKIPIYIAIGTSLDGHKEIIGTYLGNEDEDKLIVEGLHNKDVGESKNYWATVFSDLKDRGCEEVLFFSSDGIIGISEAIKEAFPNAKHQRCVTHLCSNVKKFTTKKNCKEVMKDFKKLYSVPTLNLSLIAFEEFKVKFAKNKTLVKKVSEYYEFIKPLFDETPAIRKYIYTNNISESANSKLKRGFYGRGALPNANAAINIIYFNLRELEDKWLQKKVNNWNEIFSDLNNENYKYYNKIKEYLN